jgi:hypothetical protein
VATTEVQTDVIHCRLSPELLSRIDDHVEQLRAQGVVGQLATRSAVVRIIIAERFAKDSRGASISAIMTTKMPLFLEKVSVRALERTMQSLPEIAELVAQEVSAELFATAPVRKRRR